MILRSALPRPFLRTHLRHLRPRCYATVEPVVLVGKPPDPPRNASPPPVTTPSALDALILPELRASRGASLPAIVQNYDDHAGHVLETSLPYESRPNATRRVTFEDSDGVVMVAHAIQHGDAHKIALCTGFALNVVSEGGDNDAGHTVVLSCAHTVEEVNTTQLGLSKTLTLT